MDSNYSQAVARQLESGISLQLLERRSLNSEAIVCLESVLLPTKMMPSERIARARELRAALPAGKFRARDIDAAKREDRP